MPVKGRQTIRKNGSLLGPGGGPTSRITKLWPFEDETNETITDLEKNAYFAGFGTVDRTEAYSNEIVASGRFTPEGQKAAIREFVLRDAVPALHKARLALAKAKKEAATLREKTKLQPVDKTDVVGAMMRQEIRSVLRSMPDDERGRYLSSNVDKLDPAVALAVLEAPAQLSGAPDTVRAILHDRALQAQHGDQVSELLDLERAIEAAVDVVEAARNEVRVEAGIHDPHEFDRIAAPIEAKVSAPWIRKFNEDGREVVRVIPIGGGSLRLATPEEIATGIFAKNLDEYHAMRSAT